MSAPDELEAAKARLVKDQPYVAHLLRQIADFRGQADRLRVRARANVTLNEAVQDVCWKATRDGDTYIVPAVAMQELVGAAQAAGINAGFRLHSGAPDA